MVLRLSGEINLVRHLFELCETVISLLQAITKVFNNLSPNIGSCPCKVVSGNVLDIRITGNIASKTLMAASVQSPHLGPPYEGRHGRCLKSNCAATNPCAEQPLPPYGACLLGSFNLVKYVKPLYPIKGLIGEHYYTFDWEQYERDIPVVVRAMDNVVDRAIYPLDKQRQEAHNKRRMGLGVTGLANAIEPFGHLYGSRGFLTLTEQILTTLRDHAYATSVELAKEKGAFPLFDKDKYLESNFIATLPSAIRDAIGRYGIRNSHLTSIAPTGTISLSADNVSSGIEPVFSYGYDRTIIGFDGPVVERVDDYVVRVFGVRGKTADRVTVDEHVSVLNLVSRLVDSAVSKTCNVGESTTYEEFKDVYMKAYLGGASGCTTFRASGKRYGILNAVVESSDSIEQGDDQGTACYFDVETGVKECS